MLLTHTNENVIARLSFIFLSIHDYAINANERAVSEEKERILV